MNDGPGGTVAADTDEVRYELQHRTQGRWCRTGRRAAPGTGRGDRRDLPGDPAGTAGTAMVSAELLRAAAEALDSGIDPFGGAFLREHDVTADQCLSLASQLALGARIVARAISEPKSPQGQAMMLTLVEGALT